MGNNPSARNAERIPRNKEPGSNENKPESKIMQDIPEEKSINQNKDQIEIDLAFILDCTGSMSSYIHSARDNINEIANKISIEGNMDVQFALIAYRDIPPQDTSFITKTLDFTSLPMMIQLQLSKIPATGGGDEPEALVYALQECYSHLSWRPNSIKIILVISDAPPHGLETKVHDGFPNGDIDYHNKFTVENVIEGKEKDSSTNNNLPENEGLAEKRFLNVVEILAKIRDDLQAVIYSIGCEPDLSCNFDFARDFFEYMALATNGKYLPLSNAELLPEVIVGSVKQQIATDNLATRLEEEMAAIRDEYGPDISGKRMNELIAKKWKDEGVKQNIVSCGKLYRSERPKVNINLLMNEQKVKSLKDFKRLATLLPRMKHSDFRHLNTTGGKKSKMKKVVVFDDGIESVSESESASGSDNGVNIGSDDLFCNINVAHTVAHEVDWNDGGSDFSDSCADQQVYFKEESLSFGDVEQVMERYQVLSTKAKEG